MVAKHSRRIGKAAPDIQLVTLQDKPASLSDYWGITGSSQGRSALIIFLRHLG